MNIEFTVLGRHEAWLRLSNIIKAGRPSKTKQLQLERKLASEILQAWRLSYDEALKTLFKGVPDKLSQSVINLITEGLSSALGDQFGNSANVQDELRRYITLAYRDGKSEFVAEPNLSLPDQRAIEVLTKHNCFWLGEHYGKHIGPKIAEMTQEALNDGLGRKELSRQLRDALGGAVGGYKYWDVAASAALVRSRSFGCISGMVDAGIVEYEVLAMGDERMCPICGELNGQTFSVAATQKVIEGALSITDPEKFKEAMPWHMEPPTGKSKDQLIAEGMSVPPFHANCRCVLVEASISELGLIEGAQSEIAESIRDCFVDTPKFIQDLYSQHKDTLFGVLLDAEANQEVYDSSYKVIHLNENSSIRTLFHEFGHHVDISANAKSNKFMDAVLKSVKSISENLDLQQAMKDIMSQDNPYSNDELSDIFCALVRGAKGQENLWGNAGHSADYYRDDVAVRAEIFANLFSIYARNDREAVKYLQEVSPDILGAFLDIARG